MKTPNIRGAVPIIVVAYVLLTGAAGYGGLKIWQAFSPNQHKAEVVAADTQAQAVAAQARAEQDRLAAALAADQAALAAEKKREQDAAGFIAGAGIALAGEVNPSASVQVAAKLVSDAGATLDPATQAQIAQFKEIVAAQKGQIGTLTAALAEKERESQADKAAIAATAAQAKVSDDAAKLAAATLTTQAATHAAELNKLNAQTAEDKSLIDRLKSLGIGGSVILFAVIPLLLFAFPELLPIAKALTAPLMGLWHRLADRLVTMEKQAHAATASLLEKEIAAHTATKAALVVVASAPDSTPKIS